MTVPAIPGFGVEDLDAVFGGLVPGDNVVWVAERDERYERLEAAFAAEVAAAAPALWVAATAADLRRARSLGADVADATPGSALARPAALIAELEQRLQGPDPVGVVVDGLAVLARRWGVDEAVAFFSRTCPMMLQQRAITYWRVPRHLGSAPLERIRQVTQVMVELRDRRLRVLKAEGRPSSLVGATFRVGEADGSLTLTAERAAGRLARGLAALRAERSLTQAQLAGLAGVTASAISQAESGSRGLSLDTLIVLGERLGVSLDRLVAGAPEPGYRLARHDRSRTVARSGVVALADDPTSGLRAYLVSLEGDEHGVPPVAHAGAQLVAVMRGLVQVEVAGDTPVLRAGDTVVAATAPVRSWRNLGREPATFFWTLRD